MCLKDGMGEGGEGTVSRKGGGQHGTNGTLGANGSLSRIPIGYQSPQDGHATGVAIITKGARFPGYFADSKRAMGGASKAVAPPPTNTGSQSLPTSYSTDMETVSRGEAVDAVQTRSSRAASRVPGNMIAPAESRQQMLLKSTVFAQDPISQRRHLLGQQGGRPYSGVVVPTMPNPTGQQVFGGSYKANRAVVPLWK